MIGPAQLDVLLQVPDHIREGLAAGTLIAWGGTIRDAHGHIRGLLTEGRGLHDLLQRGTPFDPKLLTDAIGHAQTAANLASCIGALNLGVSVAGFAMVRQRLDAIAAQLGRALVVLAEIKEEVVWVGGLQMAVIKADIDSALDMTVRAHRQHDRQLFQGANSKAHEVRRILHHAMSMMLETRRAVRRQQVFKEFIQVSAILAVAEAGCDEEVEGASQAGQVLRLASRDLCGLIDRFDRQRHDFFHDPRTTIELGSEGRARTADIVKEISIALRQVEGVAGQLALREALGVTRVEWRALTAPEGSGLVTCVTAPPEVDADQIDWVRGRNERR